jgi:uncharacterized membrane protein
MNTVFKFYLQVWVLFGIAAAVCIVWIVRRFRHQEAASLSETDNPRMVTSPGNAVPSVDEKRSDPKLASQPRHSNGPLQAIPRVWLGVLLLLIALAALYPILATRAKINDRWARQIGPGLNGLEWMKAVSDVQQGQTFRLLWEYEALMWLRDNIEGSPVVAEGARAEPYRSLRSRVATYTGLPIIIG